MIIPIVLASGSAIRAEMLRNAGVEILVTTARVDEQALKQSMQNQHALPRDIADALAEVKARRVSGNSPGALVIGCDQVLDFKGRLLSKPDSPDQALDQLSQMRSSRHDLFSAAVICHDAIPVWRHVARVQMYMRSATDAYLRDYVDRNWGSIRHSVGAYLLEDEGVRLFERIDGDYFSVLGMPLLEILNYLTHRGAIPG